MRKSNELRCLYVLFSWLSGMACGKARKELRQQEMQSMYGFVQPLLGFEREMNDSSKSMYQLVTFCRQ